MKRVIFAPLSALLLLGVAAASALARQSELPDLVPVELAYQPSPAVTGQPLRLTVVVANQGTGNLSAEAAPSLSLTLASQPDGSDLTTGPCVEEAKGLSGLGASESREYSFACTYSPAAIGDYTFTVVVDPANAIGEAIEDNNSLADVGVAVGEPPSALPESVSRLFAGLGLFAALMAVLAAGTEVVIDTVRLFFGLKRKPMSLESLDKLKEMLPGKLEALGAGVEAEQRVQDYVDALKGVLQPVQQVQGIYLQAKSGEIGAAVQGVVDWAARAQPDLAKALPSEIDKQVGVAVQRLSDKLGLREGFARALLQGAQLAVANVTGKANVAAALDQVVRYFQDNAPELTADWLRGQAGDLAQKGAGYVLDQFDSVVAPELKGMGLADATVAQIRDSLSGSLGEVEAQALLAANSYTEALHGLMQAVENRRYEIQSPLRKFWRRLREVKVVGAVVGALDRIFRWILGREQEFGSPVAVPAITTTNAAQILMERNDKQEDEEASRLRWLRLLSVVVGVILAYALNLDAATLLDQAVPGIAVSINSVRIPVETLNRWLNPGWLLWLLRRADPLFAATRDLTAGIILSGFAASAGSAFWHDQLDRLQAAKKSAEQAAQLVQAAKKLAGTAEGK